MCTGMEAALISAAVGTAGTMYSANVADQNAAAQQAAMNKELQLVMDRNASRQEQATELFQQRRDDIAPENAQADQAEATETRDTALQGAIDSSVSAAPNISGSAPSIIGQAFSDASGGAKTSAKSRATALATAGGFGDAVFAGDLANQNTGRKISTVNDFAQNDMAALPGRQELAAAGTKKKSTMFGDILTGLGSAGGYYAGNI